MGNMILGDTLSYIYDFCKLKFYYIVDHMVDSLDQYSIFYCKYVSDNLVTFYISIHRYILLRKQLPFS